MIFSPDKENLLVAECIIDGLIATKNYRDLKCLEHFFDYGIYSEKFNTFEVPEECDFMKEKIKKYFK